jgi:hypothetical protein
VREYLVPICGSVGDYYIGIKYYHHSHSLVGSMLCPTYLAIMINFLIAFFAIKHKTIKKVSINLTISYLICWDLVMDEARF